MNLFEKLLKVSSELKTVEKGLEVSVGAMGKYKAVGEADVLRAIKPLEEKYGIYSYPCAREIIESGQVENAKGVKQFFERIKVTYRFVNIEKPEESIEITSYGDGIDNGDKSVGKAMTYADKYALMKAYKMVTGDDPDQEASDEYKTIRTNKKPLDPALLAQCEELKIDISKVAVYLKKRAEDLTDDDLRTCIARKLAKKVEGTK